MARVTQLTIKGYRSIRNELEIAFPANQPLVLVGENNAGKSNIVRTLTLLLGQFSPGFYEPEDHDCYGRDRSVQIHVALTFDEDDCLGGRWTEIHWTYDEANDPAGSFYGVWPGTSKTFISNADRDSCACMLIEADRNLRCHLSYNSKFTFLSRLMRRFHKALMRRDEARPRREREVGQRAPQAATAGSSERDFRHLQPFLLVDVGRHGHSGQRLEHRVRKCSSKSSRFANRNQHWKPGPLADEQQRVAITHPKQIPIPVAEARRGIDRGHIVELFQPEQELLCAPKNDHQLVSVPYDIAGA